MMSQSLIAGDVNLDHWTKVLSIALSSVAYSFLPEWMNILEEIPLGIHKYLLLFRDFSIS